MSLPAFHPDAEDEMNAEADYYVRKPGYWTERI